MMSHKNFNCRNKLNLRDKINYPSENILLILEIKLNKSMMLDKLLLSRNEKKTFALHITYSFIEGIILGVLAINEFVLIKSMKSTNMQVGILFQTTVVVYLFSIILNELLTRTFRKKLLLRWIAIITRLPVMALIFFPATATAYVHSNFYQYYFLTAFLMFYMATPVIYPVINLFLKKNYTHHNFGKLFGYATTLNKIVMLIITFLFGILLDHDYYAFRYIYPVIAILAIVDIYILSLIPFSDDSYTSQTRNFLSALRDSYKNMQNILKHNKPYRDFESSFMLYGFAWMLTFTVITIYFERVLHLNYTNLAFYKNVYNILAILILPFIGKIIGRVDPRKFAAYTFTSMLLYIFFLLMTQFFPFYIDILGIKVYYTLAIAYFFFGIFTANMAMLWYIGSAYFCKPEDSGVYQAIHLSLTGVRGVYAPILGVVLLNFLGFNGVFLIGIGALVLAIRLSIVSMRKYKLNAETDEGTFDV